MKKMGDWLATGWLKLLFALIVLAMTTVLLWFGLGNILPGLSKNEISQATSSNTTQKITNNPIGLPHKALQFVTQKYGPNAIGIRSASALIGLFSIFCFYFILQNWYSKRIAVLGTLIFATSAWLLHTVRLGTDSSMYLLLLGSVACATWLQKSRGGVPSLIASTTIIILLLYIPGMIWLVVPAILWQLSRLTDVLRGRSALVLTFLSLMVLVSLTPIGWTLYQHPDLTKEYFGLPQALPEPVEVFNNIIEIPLQLFVRGPKNPEIWLGRLPLLNIFSIVMFIVGIYTYFKKRKLDRTWFTMFVFIVSGILIGLGGPVSLAILLPFVYLIISSGIALLLQQWFTVFPRNPFAKTIGTTIMTIIVLLAAFGGLNQYFIAWPNTPETKAVFTEQIN